MRANKQFIRSIVLAMGIIFTVMASSALAMSRDLVGAVVKTDQGAAISTDGGEYLVLGKDLTPMIGKTVLLNGNTESGVLANTIRVKTVKIMSNKDLIDPPPAKIVPARPGKSA